MKSEKFVTLGGALVFALAVSPVLAAPVATTGVPASAYVQDGLVAQWDGIENAGAGQHDGAATSWVDLVAGRNFSLSNVTIGERYLGFDGSSSYGQLRTDASLAFPSGTKTVEIVVMLDSTGDGIVLHGPAASGVSFGPYTSNYILINNKKAGFGYARPGTGEINSFATVYGSDDMPAKLNKNGVSVSSAAANNFWGNPDTTAWIGKRSNGKNFNGKIYAVRVYSGELSAGDISRNAQVDAARFNDTPERYRWNDTTKKIEALVSVRANGATVSIDGGTAAESAEKWLVLGESVALQVTCPSGQSVQKWVGGTPVAGGTAGAYTLTADKAYNLVAFVGSCAKTWTGTAGDGFWTTDGNWSPEGAPVAGDVVTLATGTVVLTNSTPELGAMEIVGTLAMSNWTTRLNAREVVISSGGIVKPTNLFENKDMSNRVWIACQNLTVASGGKINASGLGYGWRTPTTTWATAGQGPGAGPADGSGAGHGGKGGRAYSVGRGAAYDSVMAPTMPGSSGGANASQRGRPGGGAVRIDATGEVSVAGEVRADGTQATSASTGSGSGGSVYISCRTFRGDGVISALGANPTGGNGGGGGGGRIAIVYDTTAQARVSPKPSPRLWAGCRRKGAEWMRPASAPSLNSSGSLWHYRGEPGTVYLPDTSFYPETCWKQSSGIFHVPGMDGISLDVESVDLAADSVDTAQGATDPYLRDLTLNVTDDIVLRKGTALTLSNCTITARNVVVTNGYFEILGTSTLAVSKDFTLAGTGSSTIRAGVTNGTQAATWNAYGALVEVKGALSLVDTAVLYPFSDQIIGGSPFFRLGSLSVGASASINGYGRGWGGLTSGTPDNTAGRGPGGSASTYAGAAYGGNGGGVSVNSRTYGDEKNPTDPGSGGFRSWGGYVGGDGGGLFRAVVDGRVTINGAITMNGTPTYGSEATGGSGGGVNIACGQLAGCGSISANGGAGGSGTSYSGCGGGGRIALVYRSKQHWSGTITASAGTNTTYTYKYAATDGTIYQKTVGGMMVIVR